MYIVESAKKNAAHLKREIIAVYYAYRDPRTKLLPKILIACTLGYLLSPIDLIPDFIPLLGYIDDLIIIPALIFISVRLIPDDVMADARHKVSDGAVRIKSAWVFFVAFIVIWTALASMAVYAVLYLLLE